MDRPLPPTRRARLTSLLPMLPAVALLAMALAAAPAGAPPRVVEITARRFQFSPAEVTLRKDEPVILRLRSEDVTHGFYSKPLGLDGTIAPGEVTEIPLTPHEVGRFVTICDHFCGAGHGNMKLVFTVE